MKKKFYLVYILICAVSLTDAFSSVIGKADSLFNLGFYKEASIEYERIVCFSSDLRQTNEARYKKAVCFKLLNNFDRAYEEVKKISYVNLSDSDIFRYSYETALCAYLSGKFTEAESNLMQIGFRLRDTTSSDICLLRILNYNELHFYDKALETALLYVKRNYPASASDSLILLLEKKYSRRNLPKIKNANTAKYLSFVPGLGLVYVGNWGEGIFNFGLNLAFLSFGAYEVYYGYSFTGYFTGTIGLSKFFFGGQARTQHILQKRNYRAYKKFNEEVRDILIPKKS